MIALTGATGTVGKEVVRQLLAAHVPFRALAHSAASFDKLRTQGVDAVEIDPAHIETAVQGADHLFLLLPSSLDQPVIEGAFVDAAKRAGVRHVVKLSVFGADTNPDEPLLGLHAQSEAHIVASGLDYTFLRPNAFMQNFANIDAPLIKAQGAIFNPAADGRISHIDAADIAAVAVAALTRPGHAGHAYTLTGPEAITYAEAVQKLSARLGKPVNYIPIADADYRGALLGAGLPEWYADGLTALYTAYRAGNAAPVTDSVERVTGRPPRTFDAWLDANIAAFR